MYVKRCSARHSNFSRPLRPTIPRPVIPYLIMKSAKPSSNLFRAPLFVTRQVLYSTILVLAICLVLLPISVVSYLSFYKTLVPTERFSIPLSSRSVDSTGNLVTAFVSNPAAQYVTANPDFDYLVRLNLNAICRQEKSFHQLSYGFLIAGVAVESEHIINCDLRYIYAEKNWWIPYHLRYWVPPILVDILKLVKADIELLEVSGVALRLHLEPLHTLNCSLTLVDLSFLMVDWKQSSIDLVLRWTGVRYYLVEYYYTSLVIGVLLFWGVCSTVCLASALIFLAYLRSKFAPTPRASK